MKSSPPAPRLIVPPSLPLAPINPVSLTRRLSSALREISPPRPVPRALSAPGGGAARLARLERRRRLSGLVMLTPAALPGLAAAR